MVPSIFEVHESVFFKLISEFVWRFSGRRLVSPSTGSAPIWRRIHRHDQPSLSLLEFLRCQLPSRKRLEQFLKIFRRSAIFLVRIIKKDLIFPLSFPQGIIYFFFVFSNLLFMYNFSTVPLRLLHGFLHVIILFSRHLFLPIVVQLYSAVGTYW